MSHKSSCLIKQVGARNLGVTVECMQWSNKMDLIAFGTDKGEVIIQRLNFQRIITFPSPGDGVKVRTLAWQLEETLLAAGYSNGQVKFLDVDREIVVFSIEFNDDIKKLHFSRILNVKDYRCPFENDKFFTHQEFLPPLPPLNGLCNNAKDNESPKSFTKCAPCFLIVTLVTGQVHMLLYGALRAGSIDLKLHVSHPDEFTIYDTCVSGNYHIFLALVKDGAELKVLQFSNDILKEYMSPLMQLADSSANIYEIKHYITETMQSLLETWETVLIEMDNKLTKYCSSQPEGAISADFLDILLFGHTPRDIMQFLMDDLTEKGVKKLSSSVELSFNIMQALITKSLQNASTNMFYFLNNILGMARFQFFFQELLSEEAAEEAQRLCGSFVLKTQELHQVIERCASDMKLFLNWLHVSILRYNGEDVPQSVKQLTEQDYRYLANYLHSFEDSVVKHTDGSITKRKFNMEKIGQYFEDKNLQQKIKKHPDKLWHQLLKENECLKKSKLLFTHEIDLSLIQQRNKLFESIETLLRRSGESINASFKLQSQIVCSQLSADMKGDYVRSHFKNSQNGDMLAVFTQPDELLLLHFDEPFQNITSIRISLQSAPLSAEPLIMGLRDLRFVDLEFYSSNVLSVLLTGNTNEQTIQSCFLHHYLDKGHPHTSRHAIQSFLKIYELNLNPNSLHQLLTTCVGCLKPVEGLCEELAVSGARKVAGILNDNRKRMLIYDIDVEDDDDETADVSQNSLLDLSKESEESLQGKLITD